VSFQNLKWVIIRNDRMCNGCCERFPKGTSMLNMVGERSSDFYHVHLCVSCDHFMDTHPNYFNDDWWNEGEIGEARREERRYSGTE
jgi:hypothetical protein